MNKNQIAKFIALLCVLLLVCFTGQLFIYLGGYYFVFWNSILNVCFTYSIYNFFVEINEE